MLGSSTSGNIALLLAENDTLASLQYMTVFLFMSIQLLMCCKSRVTIFKILKNELIQSNEYLQIALLSLFARNPELNQTSSLLSLYKSSPSSLKREILLSAYVLNLGDWIRELKESYAGLDMWSKRAFIIATKALPFEERKFFLEHIKDNSPLNDLLIKWARLNYR